MGAPWTRLAEARLPAADEYLHCRYQLDGRVADTDWPTFQSDGPGICSGPWRTTDVMVWSGRSQAARSAARYLAVRGRCPVRTLGGIPEHVHTSTLAAIRPAEAAVSWTNDQLTNCSPPLAAIGDRLRPMAARSKWSTTPPLMPAALDGRPLRCQRDEPRFAATLSRIQSELISADGGVHQPCGHLLWGRRLALLTAVGRSCCAAGAGDLSGSRPAGSAAG
jgi:hypothetical protein